MERIKNQRIVITGGPSAGKTTLIEILQKSFSGMITTVPEAATVLYKGGFPRSGSVQGKIFAQQAIYHVQKEMENIIAYTYPDLTIVCDRGTLDGLAYWPLDEQIFFQNINSSLKQELDRYNWIIHLDSACAHGYDTSNPIRIESPQEALHINEKLYKIWSQHPYYFRIPSDYDFLRKIRIAEFLVSQILRNVSYQVIQSQFARFLNN